MIFSFTSRRRHTSYIGDWSSDVCSSDLDSTASSPSSKPSSPVLCTYNRTGLEGFEDGELAVLSALADDIVAEIGRASCRERVWSCACNVSVKRRIAKLSIT